MRDLNVNEIEAISGGAGLSYTVTSLPTVYSSAGQQSSVEGNAYTGSPHLVNTYNDVRFNS